MSTAWHTLYAVVASMNSRIAPRTAVRSSTRRSQGLRALVIGSEKLLRFGPPKQYGNAYFTAFLGLASGAGSVGHQWPGVVGSWTPGYGQNQNRACLLQNRQATAICSEHALSGELTFAEALAHQQNLSADPDFDPTFSHIADFTYATLTKISSDEMAQFAQRSIFSPAARRALILPNLADYGLGRMYETLRGLQGQTGVRAFRTLEDALDWVAGPLPDA